MELNLLTAISPIDGRYRSKVENLQLYFSEYALIKYRVLVEVEYFIALCELPLPQLNSFDKTLFGSLRKIVANFSLDDAQRIKDIEKVTNHDVKAVEYFLKEEFDKLNIQAAASAGDLKFREAEEYADGMKDGSRTFNIKVLHGTFNDDVEWLRKGQTFRKTYAEELKMIRKSSYDQAIKGEKIRAGSTD